MPVQKIRALLIDDEPDARAVLRILLRPFSEIEIVAEADDLPSGLTALEKHRPDLLFLDIQLGEKNGFELLEHFPLPFFDVVFCTGFDQFALRAIKNGALDYLLKPIDPDDLAAAVEKARARRAEKKPPRLALSSAGEIRFVETSSVCRIESDGPYSTLLLIDGRRFVQVRSLREFEEILPPGRFARVHQSHLVNLDFVEKMQPSPAALILKNGNEIPVARRRWAEVQAALGVS